MSRKRKWPRYVGLGHFDTNGLCDLARKNGMMVINGAKGSWMFWSTILLYGTAEAMRKTEQAWKRHGHEVPRRRPPGAISVPHEWMIRPRSEWADSSKWIEYRKNQKGA